MARRLGRRALLASAMTGSVAGCVLPPARSGRLARLQESFEDGLSAWSEAAAIGPDVDVDVFEWSVERTRERAYDGAWSVAIATEGRYDDGTAWIERPVRIEPNRSSRCRCEAFAWSEQESFNHLRDLVMYLGPTRPSTEEDFPSPGANSTGLDRPPFGGLREPLDQVAGWRPYRFEWLTPTLDVNQVYVAVGVSVVWETDRTDYVDAITIDIRPT